MDWIHWIHSRYKLYHALPPRWSCLVVVELCLMVLVTCHSPPCSWMILLMFQCLWLVLLWLVWRIGWFLGFGLCSWARTAMNCYYTLLAAGWCRSGRLEWPLELGLLIYTLWWFFPALTHRHVPKWWLGHSCMVVDHAQQLVSCVCAWDGNLSPSLL
jgi:hypothetical protein